MNHTHGSAQHCINTVLPGVTHSRYLSFAVASNSPRANMTEQGRRYGDREMAVILCVATELAACSAPAVPVARAAVATEPGLAGCAGPAGQVRDSSARPGTDQA
jgi:hypothetical protein